MPEATTDSERDLLGYCEIMIALRQPKGELARMGEAYACIEDFLAREGSFWTPQPLPERFPQMPPKYCYATSQHFASLFGLRYVEGIAAGIIPVMHAWCLDDSDRVVDATWEDTGVAYLGVVVPEDRIPSKGASLLDDWQNHWPVLQQPWR
jgi:hypothetical protein